jgi:DNA (cytosine-5)-methyltransferase 1
MTAFSWKWYLKDLKQDKDVTVFSTFSCGGGSTMGYKRAGFKVLGNVEIDPAINAMYVKNHHPKYNYNMDLREFNKLETVPEELLHLDILDGSPPCTVFSTAGLREKTWGKEKVFREGQKRQRLDDLFGVFLDTVEKLRPRVVIAENVPGLLKGNARGYVNEIINRFKELGYAVQLFSLNAARMDVPSKRERVFFIANREGFKPLKLSFNRPPIRFGEVRTETGKPFKDSTCEFAQLVRLAKRDDFCLADVRERLGKKASGFNHMIYHDEDVGHTITSSGCLFRYHDKSYLSEGDCRNMQTFPQDYDFMGNGAQYVCGMSVPPNMMAHIATEIYNQWFK